MKNIKHILLLFTVLLFWSCEEVIDADLETAPARLVAEANIDWVRGTNGRRQTIKLTKTRGYYDSVIPVVEDATVFVTNSSETIFYFDEDAGTGNYICQNFIPVAGETYVLTIIADGQTYTATEGMQQVPVITRTAQTNTGGFLGEDVEVRYYYNDFPDEDNFYMSRIEADMIPFPEYDLASDEFFQGNEMFEWFSDEDLKAGDVVSIELFGISEQYYEYMNVLLEAAGGGSPFSAIPVAARGNIVNQTNADNYALGYFRVCEVDTLELVVQ